METGFLHDGEQEGHSSRPPGPPSPPPGARGGSPGSPPVGRPSRPQPQPPGTGVPPAKRGQRRDVPFSALGVHRGGVPPLTSAPQSCLRVGAGAGGGCLSPQHPDSPRGVRTSARGRAATDRDRVVPPATGSSPPRHGSPPRYPRQRLFPSAPFTFFADLILSSFRVLRPAERPLLPPSSLPRGAPRHQHRHPQPIPSPAPSGSPGQMDTRDRRTRGGSPRVDTAVGGVVSARLSPGPAASRSSAARSITRASLSSPTAVPSPVPSCLGTIWWRSRSRADSEASTAAPASPTPVPLTRDVGSPSATLSPLPAPVPAFCLPLDLREKGPGSPDPPSPSPPRHVAGCWGSLGQGDVTSFPASTPSGTPGQGQPPTGHLWPPGPLARPQGAQAPVLSGQRRGGRGLCKGGGSARGLCPGWGERVLGGESGGPDPFSPSRPHLPPRPRIPPEPPSLRPSLSLSHPPASP
ncbi:basic salivary proline-rich protein 2-like [Heliangelus exortis]|uniref:basic salivary proline-rich protein 2-like n=1 Tax=Heliangelus exortis TaxID=472823 RepID=UPI003A8D6731